VPGALLLAVALYCRRTWRRAPERYRAYVAAHLDPTAGPPPGAEPVDEPVVARWFAAAEREDWRAAAALLARDFRFSAPNRRWPRWLFVRAMRSDSGLGDSDTVGVAVFADPGRPDVVWVRHDSVARPPRGDDIRSADWQRWTLAPDRRRIRSIELVAFVEPLVHA
jgi:hypothetical protein